MSALEEQLLKLMQEGGIAGVVVAIAVLGLGLFLRSKGMLWAKDDGAAAALGAELSKLSARVGAIEQEMRVLPTRDEIHALQLGHAAMTERLAAMDRTATSTARAVERIENFMIDVSRERGHNK